MASGRQDAGHGGNAGVMTGANGRRAVMVGSLLGLAGLAVAASMAVRSPGLRAAAIVSALALTTLGAWSAWSWAGRQGRALAQSRRRESELSRTSELLGATVASREALLASLPEGVVLFGPEGNVTYANAAARDLLGRHMVEASKVTPATLRAAVERVRGDSSRAELEFPTTGRIVEAVVVPAPLDSVVVIAKDVTAARRTEQLRRDFVTNASHELKTPVASIVALADALGQAVDDENATHRFLQLLDKEAQRMSRLVADLLDLSRLETGSPALVPVRLDEIVQAEVGWARPAVEGTRVRLVVDDMECSVVQGSESDLSLMVHNLLDNAIRYTRPSGEVRISVRSVDGVAEIRIDDTGVGIPSGDLDRIFERFYRVDEGRSRQTGETGLGLSIVRHVVQAHGGEVTVRSVLGAGSTFLVRLPLSRSQRAQSHQVGDPPR